MVEIVISEPWNGKSVTSYIVEEKNGILMFYSDQPITVGEVKTKRFYGRKRHVGDTETYNFGYIPGVEDYTIDDIVEYEKDWNKVKFFMIGSIKQR